MQVWKWKQRIFFTELHSELSQHGNNQKLLNGPTVSFAVCEPFDFPNPSLLMAPLQHETWHIIHYSVHVPRYLSRLHMAPVVSRHPNPFPQARGCLRGNRHTAPLPQRERGDDDERLQTLSLQLWHNVQQLTVSALLGPIANSSKLTIWRQQLWVMKKGKKKKKQGEKRRRKSWSDGEEEWKEMRRGKIKAGWKHILAHRWTCSRASNRASCWSRHSWAESSASRKFCLWIQLRTSPSNKT